MTRMKRLIGMPVICEGKHIGSIVRGVLRSDGKALRGLVMRDGLRLSRWIEADNIALLGKLTVISRHPPVRVVTDVLLDETTLRVTALEISSGPLDDLLDGRWYATAFDISSTGSTGHVTIPCRTN